MTHTCPQCKHTFTPTPKPRAAKPLTGPPVDLGTLTDAELYAHYKRTAPADDVAFFVARHPGSLAGVALLERARAGLARTTVFRELAVLQVDARRAEQTYGPAPRFRFSGMPLKVTATTLTSTRSMTWRDTVRGDLIDAGEKQRREIAQATTEALANIA